MGQGLGGVAVAVGAWKYDDGGLHDAVIERCAAAAKRAQARSNHVRGAAAALDEDPAALRGRQGRLAAPRPPEAAARAIMAALAGSLIIGRALDEPEQLAAAQAMARLFAGRF